MNIIRHLFPYFLVQDNQELFVSLMMPYIFNAMTHLAIDVRLMAFTFLELVIQYHPPSFFLYAEKVSNVFIGFYLFIRCVLLLNAT